VDALRVGRPEPGEFVFVAGAISERLSAGLSSGLVVRPASGYEFTYDIVCDAYVPIKPYDTPKAFQAAFVVTTAPQEERLRQLLAKCPGLRSIEEVSPGLKDGSVITIDEHGNIDPPAARPLIAGVARLRQRS
jgi:hypothetical protein